MFPAAVGIVVGTFPLRERGKAMATSSRLGRPDRSARSAAGSLVEWTWRAIFSTSSGRDVGLCLIGARSPTTCAARPGSTTADGARLGGDGPARPRPAAGARLGLGSVRRGGRSWPGPCSARCSSDRAPDRDAAAPPPDLPRPRFAAANIVLAAMSVVLVPVFFFASVYAQAALTRTPPNAGFYIMYFFLGFVIAAQDRRPDPRRRRRVRPMVLGWRSGPSVLPARRRAHRLSLNAQIPVSHPRRRRRRADARAGDADALNRAPSSA